MTHEASATLRHQRRPHRRCWPAARWARTSSRRRRPPARASCPRVSCPPPLPPRRSPAAKRSASSTAWISPANGGRLFRSARAQRADRDAPSSTTRRSRPRRRRCGRRTKRRRAARRAVPERLGHLSKRSAPRASAARVRSAGQRDVLLHVEQRQRERVVHARCIRRHPPPDRSAARRRPTTSDSPSRRAI